MAKARIMETIIAIAGEISPTLGKTINSVNKQLGGINDVAIVAGSAIAAIGKAALDSTKYLNELGTEYQKAINGVAASTGAAGEELEGLKNTIKEVYKSNFGESMQDVADGVSIVQRNTKLAGDELTKVTKGAFALSDTFGYDVAESSRAAKAMMTNFGISGEDAMSMIAAGAQNGLDFSGELIDSINEYSVQFAKLGFSADDMFSIFQQGADSGAWNLDKVGDAIKEFSIRSIDGSKGTTEAFEGLGLNAGKMMATFAAGGNEAEYAFQIVLDKLLKMDNQVERDATGVALFGTMWEDLGVDAVKAMSKVNGSTYDTKNALEGINEVKYNDLGSAIEGIKRKAEVSLLPAAESVSNAFIEIAPKVEGMVDKVSPLIARLAENIGPLITKTVDLADRGIGWLVDNGDKLIPIIGGLTTAFVVFKGAMMISGIVDKLKTSLTGVTLAQKALNLVMNMNPLSKVALLIGLLVTAGIALYQNWDTIKVKAKELWEKVTGFVTKIKDSVKTAFSNLKDTMMAPFDAVMDKIEGFKNKIGGVVDSVKNFSFSDISWPKFAAGGFTSGPSIAGEAGTEAVISFNPAYRSANLSYWAQAGRMLGVDPTYSLSGSTGGSYTNLGGVTFAPNITVQGDAKKQDIIEAIRAAYPEFLDMLDEMLAEREEAVYA